MCRWQVQVSEYCVRRIPAHLMCIQYSISCTISCFITCLCLWQISQIQTCFCVVVGPGFVSTSPALYGAVLVKSSSGSTWPAFPKKGKLGPNDGGVVSTQFSQQSSRIAATAPPLVECVDWSPYFRFIVFVPYLLSRMLD